MFANLLAAIEADINQLSLKIQQPANSEFLKTELQAKKEKLADLAMRYVGLQNQYREISGANSIY